MQMQLTRKLVPDPQRGGTKEVEWLKMTSQENEFLST